MTRALLLEFAQLRVEFLELAARLTEFALDAAAVLQQPLQRGLLLGERAVAPGERLRQRIPSRGETRELLVHAR